MSMTGRAQKATTHTPPTKMTRVTSALGSAWTQARLADRELMEIRTRLTRVSG
jgi:hypothetical protein